VARQGYVNLAGAAPRTPEGDAGYSDAFAQARAEAIGRGFFDGLLEEVCRILVERFPTGQSLRLLDAGSGEGSFLDSATQLLRERGWDAPAALGVDLALPGVRKAAARFRECGWCVADLARLPVRSSGFDVVFNVLSPANYGEFSRILAPGGLLIKVVPGERHLQEIRSLFHGGGRFSNERVVEHFGASVSLVTRRAVESTILCGAEGAPRLFHMTPLSWHATDSLREAFLAAPPPALTVSFEILLGAVP
jgi:23S rRNA (guanine745-N1)-methyltransferase